jgi:TonB family protein
MPLLEENSEPVVEVDVSALEPSPVHRQRRQMLIALALLLAALMLVLVKDRNFWFPPEVPASTTSQVNEPAESVEGESTSATEDAKTPAKPNAGARAKTKPQHAASTTAGKAAPAIPATAPVMAAASPARVVLPPLEVEVVAGDEHRTIHTSNPSVRVDLRPGTPVTSQAANNESSGSPNARVTLPPGMAQIVSRPVEPKYPLLAKQMKVQGAVVLQALIGRDGNIQGLNVLSGPQILSTAAQEAVKQWRFRPYVQSGEPVESEARITVNFTISTQ